MTRKVIQSFGLEHRCTAIFSTGAKMLREMPDQEAEICILCEQARVIEQKRHIAFRQRTDKGDVSCRVAVQFNVCPQCGFEYWDDHAEAGLDEAVREAYEKLT